MVDLLEGIRLQIPFAMETTHSFEKTILIINKRTLGMTQVSATR